MASRSLRLSPDGNNKVSEVIARRGLTQQDLAKKASLSRASVVNFLRGKPVDRRSFIEICSVLAINWEEVLADNSSTKEDIEHSTSPLLFSTYIPQKFAGRKQAIEEDLLPELQGKTRVLLLTGISGIGKTSLAECLVDKAWESNQSFQWVHLEILEKPHQDFASVATELLTRMGDHDIDSDIQDDSKKLAQKLFQCLLQKLKSHPYWIQLDSLEYLLKDHQTTETEFDEPYWAALFQRCLTEPNFPSRLVLTSQAFPKELDEFSERYPNTWAEYRLNGLSEVEERVDFFKKWGIDVNPTNRNDLTRIAEIYEGHPLCLKVIAQDILNRFGANVARYWQAYQLEFEQVERELQANHLDEKYYNEIFERKVRERIKKSLEQIPEDALKLLCCSAVFRQPVPKRFWLEMISDKYSSQEQKAIYRVLDDYALIEEEDTRIRQHNLIRSVAYDLLKNTDTWQIAECKAADLWLNEYKPSVNSNPEKVRGYLEATYHYCEAKEWKEANELLFIKEIDLGTDSHYTLRWHLEIWGHYNEEIFLCEKLLNCRKVLRESKDKQADDEQIEIECWQSIGNGSLGLGSYTKAIEAYQKSREISQTIKSNDEEIVKRLKINEVDVLSGLGTAFYNQGEYTRAIEHYEQALKISKEIRYRQSEGNIFGSLGVIFDKQGRYKDAKKYHEEHRRIAEEIGDRRGEIRALANLGISHFNLGEYKEARELFEQVKISVQQDGDRSGESKILRTIGSIYNMQEAYVKAISFIEKSLEIAKDIKDQPGEAYSLISLGNVHYNNWESPQAKEMYQRSLEILTMIGDRQGEGSVLISLGSICKAQGRYFDKAPKQQLKKYEEALGFYRQSLEIMTAIGDRQGQGTALIHIANMQIELEQYSESEENINQALAIFQSIGDRLNEAEALQSLAKLHYAQGKNEEARQYCEQALKLAQHLGIPLAQKCELLLDMLDHIL